MLRQRFGITWLLGIAETTLLCLPCRVLGCSREELLRRHGDGDRYGREVFGPGVHKLRFDAGDADER